MVRQDCLLVLLLGLIDRIPTPPKMQEAHGQRGRPAIYTDRLFLKALVIMILKRLHRVHELLAVLEQPTEEMQRVRVLLLENERYPSRRTFERRLAALPDSLPAQIGCLGRLLTAQIAPWAESGRAAAMDSTVLPAKDGAVWHKKDQEAGKVPHTRIDTEAGWTKSGWHGWVYGWKLHLATAVAGLPGVWIPLAAELTPANTDDGEIGRKLLPELPSETGFVLGDQAYHRNDLRADCHLRGIELITSQPGKYPHTDSGVEVRRIFHKLRSLAIENWNEHFKAIFEVHGPVPTKGKTATARFALGAVFTYQLALLSQIEQGGPTDRLTTGLKHRIKAA